MPVMAPTHGPTVSALQTQFSEDEVETKCWGSPSRGPGVYVEQSTATDAGIVVEKTSDTNCVPASLYKRLYSWLYTSDVKNQYSGSELKTRKGLYICSKLDK